MPCIVFRKFTGVYAWSLMPRDDALAICRSEEEAAELVRTLNRMDGPTRELAIATHQVRRAA